MFPTLREAKAYVRQHATNGYAEVDETKRTVVVVSKLTYRGELYTEVGRATCSPRDKFNPTIGKHIAFGRATLLIAQQLVQTPKPEPTVAELKARIAKLEAVAKWRKQRIKQLGAQLHEEYVLTAVPSYAA